MNNPRIDFNFFAIKKVNVSKAQNMTLTFVELRVDDNGIYDITHTQQDWRFRNDLIFELVNELIEFIPTNEKNITLEEVEFTAQHYLNEDEQSFTINFTELKFKFTHQIGETSNITTAKTQKIDINDLAIVGSEVDSDIYEKIKTIIEKINVNVYEFCVLGTTFQPETVDSDDLIG